MSHSSESPGNDQIREAALDGVKGASKPLANSAQNRERHIGGHLSGDGPINPSIVPGGHAPGAQHREAAQEEGNSDRDYLGIDGTMGDAQDVPHPFIASVHGDYFRVCGLARSYRKHTDGATL